MGEKVTIMVLKVDLQCPCCYKKVKKIICKFPQIRDQVYKEKENKVVITVVCCNPEKIRDKLCCKGAKVIKSIEIVDPPKPEKPKPVEPGKPKPTEPEKPKPEKPKPTEPEKPEPEKPKPEKPKPTEPEKPKPEKPKPTEPEKPKPTEPDKPKPPPKPEPPKPPTPEPCGCPPCPPILGPGPCWCPPVSPVRTCCGPCSQGYGGGPCYFGHGPPPMPQPCFDGCYVYGCHDRPCHVTRCDYYYFSEENPQSCLIM
ncbi:protein PYRICULARIA ORYZAE RESISTANCE 21-like isoform X1 [Salvia hispanica]|uniref:protein PYRICULARIA ORYZAE RESISTANCE 21-like isoform X1 n=1 Tax=Salvia hispanica TaxID=49212 RepID=UPI00200900D6|nr:protein PYRICULARIA ORYZAE RESISTANCE 21-like isoform X1 [Salvia hispanica]